MRAALVVGFSFVLSGCALLPSPPPTTAPAGPTIHVANATPLTISIEINGETVATSDRSRPELVATATIGNPPWHVEARGGTRNRILVALAVAANDGSGQSVGQYVDLSCGRIWLWVGDARPDAPQGPFADQPGDCPG
jgi:hypothetical protein